MIEDVAKGGNGMVRLTECVERADDAPGFCAKVVIVEIMLLEPIEAVHRAGNRPGGDPSVDRTRSV